MSNHETTRREVLGAAGTIATVGLAGCLGTPESGGGSTPTATATETKTKAPTEAEESGHHEEGEHHTDDGHEEDGGHGADGPVEHVEVEMLSNDTGHHFHPHVAWVEPGGTVTFRNASGSHTTTAYHPDNDRQRRIPEGAEPFDSGLLTEQGATFEHTFEEPGVYDVLCVPHEGLGMIGTVLVGEPDPHGQPGLSEPGDGMGERPAKKIEDLNAQVQTMLGHDHGETSTETEQHEDDGHHGETETEQHEDDGHHEETATEPHEEDGHHDETETEHHE